MVYNDIFPGFPWTQAFDFPVGVLTGDASVRADFRRHSAAPLIVSVAETSGIVRQGDQIIVSLTGEQTALMAGKAEVVFDFVRTPDETHLGVRVHVPISTSVTAP